MKRHRRGDARADGRIFWDYRPHRGREIEVWLPSQTFDHRLEREQFRAQRRWENGYRDDPIKNLARRQLQKAVRAGRIKKPEACQSCGDSGIALQGHHDAGYDKALEVLWLCRTCHGAKHRRKAA
jgi:hypothetical protein